MKIKLSERNSKQMKLELVSPGILLVDCIHGNCVMGHDGEVIKKLTDVLAD